MNLLLFNLRVDRDDTALGFTTDWINELAKHFDHVTVITMYRGVVAVAPNVDVISAGLEHGWSKPRRVLEFYRALFAALRARRFDCCFAHMMPLFLVLAGPVLKAKGIPAALWYAHNHKPPILPLATAFAARALASTPTAFPMRTPKLRVIGQGIDTGRFRPAADAQGHAVLRLVSVGRFSKVKNIGLILRAVARLHAQRPALPIELRLIGECLTAEDRLYQRQCEELARELEIEALVRWCPPVPFHRVHEVYQESDIFLNANDNGLDKAILEAMASGLPVVAMHPAVSEQLGRYYVTEEEDYCGALIALADLKPPERLAMGRGLREFVEREHGLPRLGKRIAEELKDTAR